VPSQLLFLVVAGLRAWCRVIVGIATALMI
jgi:hypothetical protein